MIGSFSARVVRPVSRREIESNPEAAEADDNQSDRLRVKYVWDEKTGREWDDTGSTKEVMMYTSDPW